MGTRDDDTPELRPPGKRRPESLWGDTQRANAGLEHRRAEAAGLDSESRRARRSAAIPVPVVESSPAPDPPIEDDITSPHDLLERELSESQIAIIKRSRRESSDPATYEDVVKLAETLTRARREERSNNTERANQLMELLNKPPGDTQLKLSERIGKLEASFRIIRIIVWLVIGSGSGSLLVIAERIWDRAEREGEATIRLQHVEDRINEIRDDIRAQLRRYPPAAERPGWPQPSTKEAQP